MHKLVRCRPGYPQDFLHFLHIQHKRKIVIVCRSVTFHRHGPPFLKISLSLLRSAYGLARIGISPSHGHPVCRVKYHYHKAASSHFGFTIPTSATIFIAPHLSPEIAGWIPRIDHIGYSFPLSRMAGSSWRICIFARPLFTSRRIVFRAKLENATHFLAGDSHQIATVNQFYASKLARIDYPLLLGSELSIFSFQCPQTAFTIFVLRITIFAHYIGILLA